MQINDREATSGSIVVGPGQQGTIKLPWGAFALLFKPKDYPKQVTLHADRKEIVFSGVENPLGTGAILNLPQVGGTIAFLNIAVYSIGDGDGAYHIVHYTVVV